MTEPTAKAETTTNADGMPKPLGVGFTQAEPTNRIPDQGEGIKAIADLAQKANGVAFASLDINGKLGKGLPDSIPLQIDLRNGKVESLVDLIESYRTEPERKEGTASTTTLQSFIDLVNHHKLEASVVFAQTRIKLPNAAERSKGEKPVLPSLTAVINYSEKNDGAARNADHRIHYPFPITDEFKIWLETDHSPMEQAEFAAFLEEHVAELSAPTDFEASNLQAKFGERVATPSEVIALSRNLEVFVGQTYKRAERLTSGERTVEFVEQHNNAKGEKIDIPGIFVIAVAAFQDGEPVRIPARLRYRPSGGKLIWFYQLYRWEDEVHGRIKDDIATVVKETSLPAFEGESER